MAKEFKITQLRLADLQKELTYLKTTREREIAAMIAEARSYGDLSENSEYDAAKNEQAKLYGRIAEIEDTGLPAPRKPTPWNTRFPTTPPSAVPWWARCPGNPSG